jgi:hypothetical protein
VKMLPVSFCILFAFQVCAGKPPFHEKTKIPPKEQARRCREKFRSLRKSLPIPCAIDEDSDPESMRSACATSLPLKPASFVSPLQVMMAAALVVIGCKGYDRIKGTHSHPRPNLGAATGQG